MALKISDSFKDFAARFRPKKGKGGSKPKMKLWYIVGGAVVALILFLTVYGFGIYKYKWEDNYTKTVATIVPYPVATVNGHIIRYSDYLEQLNIIKKYQVEFKKVDFKNDEGKKVLASIRKDTLNRLIEDQLVRNEAKKLNVSLSTKEVNDSYADLIKSNGGEKSFSDVLMKYYGLTSDEFKNEVYTDRLLRQKVSDKFANDDSVNQDAKNKAQEVLNKVKAGEDFATLAKKYSQDSTAANGGDLGLFGKGKMVPEFEKAAFAMKAGQVSDLVKTVYGYHIIKVTEVKGDEIRASHILIKTQDFNGWLAEQESKAKIKDFIHVR
jgi:foldase protein PrsA